MENRVNWGKEKWKYCHNAQQLSEQLFLLGFIAYLGANVWTTTMFPFSGTVSKCLKLVYLSLAGIKVIVYDRYQLKAFLVLLLCGISTVLVLISSGYNIPFLWLLLIVGSKDVSFEKILKVYLIVTGGIVLLAFCSSLLGVIENLQYSIGNGKVRNSFGILYTTDFAAHIFYLLIVYFYLKGEKLCPIHYMGGILTAALVYKFCEARVDTICIILTMVLFGTGNLIMHSPNSGVRVRELWRRLWKVLGPYVVLIFATISILMTALYNKESTFWKMVDDKLFHSRLTLGKEGMEEYGFSLFGKYVEMNGGGGTTKSIQNYFFLDCSYVNMLLRFGIVILLVLLGIHVYCCMKNRHDLYFLYAIALIGLNSVIAHHMIEVEYSPFMLAVLSTTVRTHKNEPSITWYRNPGRMRSFPEKTIICKRF